MDTERKMGYINERKRQQRREHKLRKFTTLFLIYWVGFSLTIMIFLNTRLMNCTSLTGRHNYRLSCLKSSSIITMRRTSGKATAESIILGLMRCVIINRICGFIRWRGQRSASFFITKI